MTILTSIVFFCFLYANWWRAQTSKLWHTHTRARRTERNKRATRMLICRPRLACCRPSTFGCASAHSPAANCSSLSHTHYCCCTLQRMPQNPRHRCVCALLWCAVCCLANSRSTFCETNRSTLNTYFPKRQKESLLNLEVLFKVRFTSFTRFCLLLWTKRSTLQRFEHQLSKKAERVSTQSWGFV